MHSTKVSFWKLLWLLLAPLGALYVTMCYYPSTHPQSSCFFFFIEPTAGSQLQYQSMKLRATHATQAAKETNKYTSQEKFDNLANHWDIVLKIVAIVVGSVRSSLCYDVLLPIRKTPVFCFSLSPHQDRNCTINQYNWEQLTQLMQRKQLKKKKQKTSEIKQTYIAGKVW